ncbi:hypothetical protein V6N13_125284 [Hibiscus sabdariffa]
MNDVTTEDDSGVAETGPMAAAEAVTGEVDEDRVPQTIHKALQSDKWKEAVLAEYEALQQNGTWSLVPLPTGRTIVGCKWLFMVKKNTDGIVQCYKVRLVTKGYSQVPGQDFQEIFSPVVKSATISVVLALATMHQWQLRQVDVNNTFLNGDLTEEVFMEQPSGFEQLAEDGSRMVCKFNNVLYGPRQAPRSWYSKLKNHHVSIGFERSRVDSSLFTRRLAGIITYVLVYVDDIVITGSSDSDIEEVVKQLGAKFSLKDLGALHYFLGFEVTRCDDAILLSQKKIIRELLVKTHMDKANLVPAPMLSTPKLVQDGGSPLVNASEYRSVVSSLLYIYHTWPDIMYSVHKLAQFMQNPCEQHLAAMKRVLRYLSGTIEYSLVFSSTPPGCRLTAFYDANWGGNTTDRRLVYGNCAYLGSIFVLWSSKKQKMVARSTTEAEYRSLVDAASEVIWLGALLDEMGVKQTDVPVVWCDNS